MKRKLDEIESDHCCGGSMEDEMDTSLDEILTRPTKRINMYFNTPTHFKDEKKRIVKMSRRKLKAIDSPEADLLRSVLINNTFRRLKTELRDDRKAKHLKYFSKPATSLATTCKISSCDKRDASSHSKPTSAHDHVADLSRLLSANDKPAVTALAANLCELSEIPLSKQDITRDKEESRLCEHDNCVAMDTTDSDRDMYTSVISSVECNTNTNSEVCSGLVPNDTLTRSQSSQMIHHHSSEQTHTHTNLQSTSSANTDASLLISTSDSSSVIMDSALESDNEEIDVCTCIDEQALPLMRDASVNTDSSLQSVQSVKHARDNENNMNGTVLSNSCAHENNASDFSNLNERKSDSTQSAGLAQMSDGVSWLAYGALSRQLYMLGHTMQESPVAPSSPAAFKNSFNKPPVAAPHMQNSHSILHSSFPRSADYCSKYSTIASVHLRTSHLIGAVPSLYFPSPTLSHYSAFMQQEQQQGCSSPQSPADSGTVADLSPHSTQSRPAASAFISCNLQRRPSTGAPVRTFKDTHSMNSYVDMVACT